MKKIRVRESNFELLRIIAIILIIISHVNEHVFEIQILNYGSNEMFNTLYFFKRLYLIALPTSLGKIGNHLFILVSGYYLCNKTSIDLKKQIIKLTSQMLFVALFLTIFSLIIQCIFNGANIQTVLINTFNEGNCWWFAGYYLSIIIIGNYILNNHLKRLNKKQYERFLLVIFILFSLHFSRNLLDAISPNITKLLVGIFMYSLGGYINRFNPFKYIKNRYFIISIIISFVLQLVCYRIHVISNINYCILNNTSYFAYFDFYYEYSIIPIVIALSMFELFRRLNINYSFIINNLSVSTFMIYLIHENDLTFSIIKKINYIYYLYNDMAFFIFMFLFTVLILLLIGFVFYEIYKILYLTIIKHIKL